MELLMCTISRLKVCFTKSVIQIIYSESLYIHNQSVLLCGSENFTVVCVLIFYKQFILGSFIKQFVLDTHTAQKTTLILPQSAICNLILFYENKKKKKK